ncbi:MAG: response regulator [Myxococcaceae bacterium]|jgi:CheY-like chemotaxis protein|nr:response regulator [Myxococcaceae bacterium]MCA3014095.1 response regulator [Myxococcaceae bacterium]
MHRPSVDARRILLIDDSELTLQLEKAVLEQRGYEVAATTTLDEFQRLLADFAPDLILADIHMPGAHGADLCRTLKGGFETRDIPVVLFSSLDDDALADLAQQAGADGFLSKAHGLEALGAKVDALVDSILW